MNFLKVRKSMRFLRATLILALLYLSTTPDLSADNEVTKLEVDNRRVLTLTIQQKEHKYSALLQPVLPSQFPHASWSCEYHPSSGVQLLSSSNEIELKGKQSVTVETAVIKITADPGIRSGSIGFDCTNQAGQPRSATINLKLIPEASPGQNVIKLGDSGPVPVKLVSQGDRYIAKLDFIGASPFNCNYTIPPDWQLNQDGAPANGSLLNIVPGKTKVDLVAPAAADKSQEFPINLICGDSKGESTAKLQVTFPSNLALSQNGRTSGGTPVDHDGSSWESVWLKISLIVLVLVVVGGFGTIYWLLIKPKKRQNTILQLDDKSLSEITILNLARNESIIAELKIPQGHEAPQPPTNKYVSIAFGGSPPEKIDGESNEWVEGGRIGAESGSQTKRGKVKLKGQWKDITSKRSEKQRGDTYTYTLTLKRGSPVSGGEVLLFSAKQLKEPGEVLRIPIFVWWSASEQQEAHPANEPEKVQPASNQRLAANGDPGEALSSDLKGQIANLGNELNEFDRRLSQQIERLIEHVTDPRTSLDLADTVTQAKKDILDSLYSNVNQAAGNSLGEIRDAVKRQMKEDLDRQFQQLKSLLPSREQVRQSESTNGASDGLPHLGLQRFVSEQAGSADVQKAMRQIIEAPAPANDGPALTALARNLRDLALAVEEVEERFQSTKGNVPKLAAEIRLRLLRLEWLAQKYEDFRRNNSLPTSVELNTANGGLKELSCTLAKAIESSLQYWQSPKEYLEAALDRLISRDLPELIKMCDSAGRNLFDDAVRKLLESAHLEDISPRTGDRYDPAGHLVLDYENGNRDTVVRVMTRGFRYKQQVLSKPTVIVGR